MTARCVCSAADWSAEARICTIAAATWSAADFCCWVARIDSSSIVAVDAISSPTSRAWRVPCSVAMIVELVSSWTEAMISRIDSVESIERSASLRTSAATTANPRPASPARAASIAALSASRFVCSAIALMSSRISPIFWLRSPSDSERSAIVSTFSCMSRIVSPVCSAAPATARALSAIDVAVTANSSIVADVSVIAADCSAVVASASWAAVRSSCATSPSAPIDERVCTTSALRRASRRLVRRISRSAAKAKAAMPTIASRPAEQCRDQGLVLGVGGFRLIGSPPPSRGPPGARRSSP